MRHSQPFIRPSESQDHIISDFRINIVSLKHTLVISYSVHHRLEAKTSFDKTEEIRTISSKIQLDLKHTPPADD